VRVVAAIAVLVAACESLSLGGIPVTCEPEIDEDACLLRAETGLTSLAAEQPRATQINVTCDAEKCDEDEGAGQVIIVFADGTREVVDIGFGRTN
jgi:hypothetical protein